MRAAACCGDDGADGYGGAGDVELRGGADALQELPRERSGDLLQFPGAGPALVSLDGGELAGAQAATLGELGLGLASDQPIATDE